MPQTFMRSFVVVVERQQPSHLAHLAPRLEQIGVQELVAERSAEAFRKSVKLITQNHLATNASLRWQWAVSLRPITRTWVLVLVLVLVLVQ